MTSSPLKTLALLFSLVLVRSATAAQPAITSPAPGSVLSSSSTNFQWSSGTGITAYSLSVGSSLGGYDLYNQNQKLNLSATVTNLPMDGRTLYVRLSWLTSGGWQSGDSTYTAAGTNTPIPQMISPEPGSTLTNTSATFQWTYGAGVTQYYLSVGSSPGATNIYYQNQHLNSSATVTGLPTNGMPLYVQLSWLTSGGWQSTNCTYTMVGTNTPVPVMISPAPGSTLTNTSVTFQWTYGTEVTKYYLSVGSSLGATNIYYQNQHLNSSATVTNLPAYGMLLYVQLSWLTSGGWQSTNCTYTAAGTNTPTPQMISPVPGSTLTNTSATFQWTYGDGGTEYYLSVGSSPGATDIYSRNENLSSSALVTGLPTNGMTLYVRLSWLASAGWQSVDSTNTAAGHAKAFPEIISPAQYSKLSSSSVTFQWTYGVGVTKYYLAVGSSLGATDLYYQNENLNLSATVTNLPTNGMTLYVRLWWLTSGGWQSGDYNYTMIGTNTPVPAMSSPAPGSALSSSSATFQWTYGAGVAKYYLAVGSTLGATNIYYQNQNLNSSAAVTGLPTNGMTLYVRLWWLASSTWLSADYTYNAAITLGAHRQGANIIVAWPTNDPAYTLEYATNLPASSWVSNPISPSILNGRYTVTNGISIPFTIYRLAK